MRTLSRPSALITVVAMLLACATPASPVSAAPALPAGVPIPPDVPAIVALNNPVNVLPTGGDDSSNWNALMNAGHDLDVQAGSFTITNVTLPTGRNIHCEPGAILNEPNLEGDRAIKIGATVASQGNNQLTGGCILQGTLAVDWSNVPPCCNYSEGIWIGSGLGVHTSNVLIAGWTIKNIGGDGIITYSPCGLGKTGSVCNGGQPGAEGPDHIFIVNNTVAHMGQPNIHLNGGQYLYVAGNESDDGSINPEADKILQVFGPIWLTNNTVKTLNVNRHNPAYGSNGQASLSCTGDTLLREDDSRCYAYGNNIIGSAVIWKPAKTNSKCIFTPGNYQGQSIGSATLSTGC